MLPPFPTGGECGYQRPRTDCHSSLPAPVLDSRAAGRRWEEAVLVHGGARDPKAMLADAFGGGRDVSVENMLDDYVMHLSRLKRDLDG